jgi:signal transduction histidine kinase
MVEGRQDDFKHFIRTISARDLLSVRLTAPDGSLIASSPANPGMEAAAYSISLDIKNDRPCQRCHGTESERLATLGVEVSREDAMASLTALRERTLITSLIVVAALWASIGLAATLLITRPLRAMEKAAPAPSTGRRDESGALSVKLDSMISGLIRAEVMQESKRVETMQNVEKMAYIGEMASAIAHEIKNPLAGISGAIQVFSDDFPPGDPRKDIITEILGEIGRLDKAEKDLLSFARQPEPHFILTPVESVIERCLMLISGQADKEGIRVDAVAPEEPVKLLIDPEQMQQVFLNIMINSLHSMPGGGTLTVITKVRKDEGRVEVSFTDTGQGIPDENLGNIFKPFFTTKHTGTGLGLAISKNIVDKHRGKILVESEVGSGSTFRVLLPLGGEDA